MNSSPSQTSVFSLLQQAGEKEIMSEESDRILSNTTDSMSVIMRSSGLSSSNEAQSLIIQEAQYMTITANLDSLFLIINGSIIILMQVRMIVPVLRHMMLIVFLRLVLDSLKRALSGAKMLQTFSLKTLLIFVSVEALLYS